MKFDEIRTVSPLTEVVRGAPSTGTVVGVDEGEGEDEGRWRG